MLSARFVFLLNLVSTIISRIWDSDKRECEWDLQGKIWVDKIVALKKKWENMEEVDDWHNYD